MYPAVVKEDVMGLFIPKVDKALETKIVSLIKEASKFQQHFFSKKKASSNLLNEFLLPIGSPPSPTETRRSGVDLTEVMSSAFFSEAGAQRFDAEFFRGEYMDFDNACSKLPNFLLGEKFKLNPGRTLTPSTDTCSYAKQAVLTNIGINWSALNEEHGTLAKGAWKVQANDILLACTAHEIAYVGRKCDVVTSLPDGIKNVGCVPDMIIIRPRENIATVSLYYVAAFLRSPSGLFQVQRCIRGLRGGHIYKDDLEKYVRIPSPPDKWMETFDALEKEAEIYRGKAKDAVKTAVQLLTSAFDKAVK